MVLASLTFESTVEKDLYVIADAVQLPQGMPCGHMANNQAKVVAAAIVAQLFEFVAAQRTSRPVVGTGGVSAAPGEVEGAHAWDRARAAWADTLA